MPGVMIWVRYNMRDNSVNLVSEKGEVESDDVFTLNYEQIEAIQDLGVQDLRNVTAIIGVPIEKFLELTRNVVALQSVHEWLMHQN
jgi:hypothetical protein